MVACQQAVLALGWLVAVLVMRSDRRAALHWSAYAAFAGVSLVLYVRAVGPGGEVLRAMGNVMAMAGVLCLHRGVRLFSGRAADWRMYLLPLALAASVAWLGMDDAYVALRVAVMSGMLAVFCWMTAWDVRTYARKRLQLRWGVLLAMPLFMGAAAFVMRSLSAVMSPGWGVTEITANTALHTGSAVMYLLTGLVFHLGLAALVGARLMADLRRLSRHDGLTELLNRRAMEEALDQEARRAARTGKPFAVLMLDADHFKCINDTHGHAAGDSALRYLAGMLRSQMRDLDLVGRVGGEEFLVLLPESTVAQGMAAAGRIREALGNQPHQWQGCPLPVTVSTGVAAWQGQADEVILLLRRADAALYKAKALGRDRFVAHGEVELSAGAPAATADGP